MVQLQPDGRANIATAIAFTVVDILAVFLRIVSKRKTKHQFSSDDFWIICALIFYFVWVGIVIYSIAGIAGSLDLDPMSIKDVHESGRLSKILWIGEPFFPLTITSVKISILCLYRTIFSTRQFRMVTYILSALCGLWLVAVFCVDIFQCRPIRAVYDLSLAAEAHCVPFGSFNFVIELINALIDVAILSLPVFIVHKLQLRTRQKVQVIAVFLVGSFVLVTCILRMAYSFDPKDPAHVPSNSRAILWATVQLGVAIMCACLPTFRPLLPRGSIFVDTFRSWYVSLLNTTRSRTAGTTTSVLNHESSRYNRFDCNGSESTDKLHTTHAVGGEQSKNAYGRGDSYPLQGITVESRVDVD